VTARGDGLRCSMVLNRLALAPAPPRSPPRWQVATVLAGIHFGDLHQQPRASRLALRIDSFGTPEIHFPTPAGHLTGGGQGLPVR
jgi:hypothetical protein